ncbi:WYL domain protein [compost metagenome]
METHNQPSRWEAGQEPEGLKWSQQRRLKFIDFRLRWDGRINRNDLVEFFEISMPQASADLSRYSEAAPDNMEYDRSAKAFLRTKFFEPAFERSASKAYLTELLALVTEVVEPRSSFVNWHPPVATLPVIGRQVDGGILMCLLQAIKEKRMVNVEYQSVQRPASTQRVLSPHALAHDGFRWHVRAFCHTRKKFLDYVIARMTNAIVGAQSSIAFSEDQEWHTEVVLKIGPNPHLADASRRALEFDYSMSQGVLEVRSRHAMLFYVLLKFGLLSERHAPPVTNQLVLLNRDELQPYLEMLFSGQTELPDSQRLL